jgi:hypothetical protein
MKKNLLLYKTLINLKFFNYISDKKKILKIDINLIFESIKQFIRLIYFTRKNLRNDLNIVTSSTQIRYLLKNFINLNYTDKLNLNKKDLNSIAFLLFLNNNHVQKPKNINYINLYYKNIFMISQINAKMTNDNNSSVYNIFINLNNLQKLFFIISIINKLK